MRGRAQQSGFTLLEAAVGVTITAMLLTTASAVLGTTNALVQGEDERLESVSAMRSGLETIANVLRAADAASLDGFDAFDVAAAPTFRRVTGAAGDTPTLGPVEWIEWRAGGAAAQGVAQPGAVWLDTPAGDRVLVENVPANGFEVVRQGRSLAVRLETYVVKDTGEAARATRWIVVSLRNAQ